MLFYFIIQSIHPLLLSYRFFSLQFFCLGFLFGNLRAIAMEPVGHIAGIGAAITGFISTLMAVPIKYRNRKICKANCTSYFHWIFDLFIYFHTYSDCFNHKSPSKELV